MSMLSSSAAQGQLSGVPLKLTSLFRNTGPIVVATVAAVMGVIVYAARGQSDALPFDVKLTNVANLLAPLAFTAAVVERVVEIFISPWRDAGASKLEKALAAIQTRPADSGEAAQKIAAQGEVSDALDEYRGVTQRYAFAISLVVGTCVSIAGVRALEPFIDSAKLAELAKLHPRQHLFFLSVVVALSASAAGRGSRRYS